MVSAPPTTPSSTVILVAAACLTAFCTASTQQKYNAASTSAGCRPIPPSVTVTGTLLVLTTSRTAAATPSSARAPRVDAPGEVDEGGDGGVDRVDLLLQHRAGTLGRAHGHLLRESQVDHEGDEVLLGTVVDVALEAATLGVEGVDQASARHLELVGPRRQLHGASGQLGAEADTAQHQPRLRCQTGEQALLDRRQRLVVVLLEPQHPETFVGEHDVERAEVWVGEH